MTTEHIPGLDYDFLRYMNVLPENQRRIHSYYLPYFSNCQRVADLGCGDADFVSVLLEEGIDVTGIDSDDKAYEVAIQKGLPVVKSDVFDWVNAQPDASYDGVFSAHLIEHLPYMKVVELIQQSYRILRPGGILLLATPNVRSLFSHLEMFYLHFGHVTFYHPRLVCFFLDQAGFHDPQVGENPETASPLLFNLSRLVDAPLTQGIEWSNDPTLPAQWDDKPIPPLPNVQSSPAIEISAPQATFTVAYQHEVPMQGRTPVNHLSYRIKRLLTRWLVQPLTDSLARQVQEGMNNILQQNQVLQEQIQQLHHQKHEQYKAVIERQAALSERQTLLEQRIEQVYTLVQQEQTVRREQTSSLENADRELSNRIQTFGADVQALNGPFETYIWAYKPTEDSAQEPV